MWVWDGRGGGGGGGQARQTKSKLKGVKKYLEKLRQRRSGCLCLLNTLSEALQRGSLVLPMGPQGTQTGNTSKGKGESMTYGHADHKRPGTCPHWSKLNKVAMNAIQITGWCPNNAVSISRPASSKADPLPLRMKPLSSHCTAPLTPAPVIIPPFSAQGLFLRLGCAHASH